VPHSVLAYLATPEEAFSRANDNAKVISGASMEQDVDATATAGNTREREGQKCRREREEREEREGKREKREGGRERREERVPLPSPKTCNDVDSSEVYSER